MRLNPAVCAVPALSGGSPAADEATHAVAGALRLFLGFPGPPAPYGPPRPDAATDCRTVLAYLQLGLGLVAPALVLLVLEARLHQQHAEQRRHARLEREGGVQAALCERVAGAAEGADWVSWLGLAWLLSALLHALAGAIARAQA